MTRKRKPLPPPPRCPFCGCPELGTYARHTAGGFAVYTSCNSCGKIVPDEPPPDAPAAPPPDAPAAPPPTARETWPACDYWSLDDCPDELSHTSVVEALRLDDFRDAEHFISWLAHRTETGNVTVYGWTRKTVSQADIDSMVEHLTEAFHEHWCESLELGNTEDGMSESSGGPEWLRAACHADMRKRHVWQCEQTHCVWLTPDEFKSIVRRTRPELVVGGG